MPTVFDRWPTGVPSFHTKYADGQIIRICTEGKKDTRLGQSDIREMTVRFLWKQRPFRPDAFMIGFSKDQADARPLSPDMGADIVFRANSWKGLRKSTYFELYCNMLPTSAVGATTVTAPTMVQVDSTTFSAVQTSYSNIEPVYDQKTETISGFTSIVENYYYRTSTLNARAWQREGWFPLSGGAAGAGDAKPTKILSGLYGAEPYADVVLEWTAALADNNNMQVPEMPVSPGSSATYLTPVAYTVLLYRQQPQVAYYGARSSAVPFVPAKDTSGLLAVTALDGTGAFLELT